MRIRLPAPDSYHLRHTMSILRMGRSDPSLSLSDGLARWAMWTPEGPAALEVAHQDRHLDVSAWGSGCSWMLARSAPAFGLDDAPHEFRPTDRIKRLRDRYPGTHLPCLPVVFPRVVQIVLQQLVSWQDAFRAWNRVVRRFGQPAPGLSELWLPPAAAFLKSIPYYDLVACGVLPRQARTIRCLAACESRIEQSAAEGAEAFSCTLRGFPGVGEWTVQYALGSALGEADAVLTGDYDMPHSVAWYLTGEPRSTDERMLQLLEPYRGHRFRVIRLLWLGGVRAPRRGPRIRSVWNRS